jgi:hypothetical protein
MVTLRRGDSLRSAIQNRDSFLGGIKSEIDDLNQSTSLSHRSFIRIQLVGWKEFILNNV